MPDLDLTELMNDPDFCETFIVVRRKTKVNDHGRSDNTPERITVVGSVTPTADNSLTRDMAMQMQAKSVKVITRFALRGPSKDKSAAGTELRYMPDVIVWQGDSYEPVDIRDYSRFGAGFIEADCMSVDYVDQAPETR